MFHLLLPVIWRGSGQDAQNNNPDYYYAHILKALKTHLLNQLLTISDGVLQTQNLLPKFKQFWVFHMRDFSLCCLSMSHTSMHQSGLSKHLSENVLTVLGLFAHVDRPLSIKSDQTTHTHTHTVLKKQMS